MSKKQYRNRLFVFLGTLALALGLGSVISNQKDMMPARAVAIPSGTSLYLKPNSNWLSADQRFAAYFYTTSGGSEWVDLTAEAGVLDIYKVVAPATEYATIIFTRMNGATTENNWDNKWNQTADLTYDGTNNLFTIPDGAWDSATTTWSVYDPDDHPLPPTVTLSDTTPGIKSDKVRIWLDRGGHYEDGYTHALKIGETRYRPTGWEMALKLTETNRWFAYYDVPISELTGDIGITIVNASLGVTVEIPAVPYTAGDNNKVWKINFVDPNWSITKGAITERIYNSFFAKVLEGYLSCDESAINGFMAFDDIDTNFLPRTAEVWNMEGDLGGQLIKDFLDKTDYTTGTRETVAATDAYAKYTMMQGLFNAENGGGSSGLIQVVESATTNVSYIIALMIMTLTLLAGSVFCIFKAKRQ